MRDRAIFAAACALVALHAAADAFLLLEPGASRSGHLARGLVPLALLACSVAAYPRLRDGARATLALLLAPLAAVGAGLAVADARLAGPRGEDWTGFLLVPAAAAFAVVGVTLLLRSRKRRGRRWLRRSLLAAAAVVGVYVVVAPLAIALVATHRPRQAVAAPDLGRPYEQVTIRTADGVRLAAFYLPSRNGAALISAPTRQGKLAHARMLARHGYGVLLLDLRGYDGSDGDVNLFGWGGARDVDAAVAWLARRPDVRGGRIGGIGFSVGGEVMLEAAAGNPALRAVVSEGAGERSVRETLSRGPRGWPAVPTAAVQTLALTVLSGRRRRPRCGTSSGGSRRGRCSSSRRARAPAGRT